MGSGDRGKQSRWICTIITSATAGGVLSPGSHALRARRPCVGSLISVTGRVLARDGGGPISEISHV